MNFSKIFSKTSNKPNKPNNPDSVGPDSPHDNSDSSSASPTKRKSSSPTKGKSDARDRRPNSKRHNTSPSKSRSPFYDLPSHPLNLPPEERKRLSALSMMSADPAATDRDMDISSSPPPTSPGTHTATNGLNGVGSPMTDATPPLPPSHSSPTSPLPTPAAEDPPEDPDAYKAQGNKFFKAKKYDKAIEEYSKAIRLKPDVAPYRGNRAAALLSAHRYNEALEDAKLADELEPNNEKFQHRLARIYTSLGRPEEAIRVFEQIHPPVSAKDRSPADAMLQHISQAQSALEAGTTGSMAMYALDQAERGLGSGVNPPRKWKLMRGEAYLKMGNVNALGDAQNVAMSLLRDNSADPEALVLRGRVLYAQDDMPKALQHFRQAISCDPDFSLAVKYLRMVQKLDRMKSDGNALFKAGKFPEAIEQYTQALEVDPSNKGINAKLLQNRALCYSKRKDYTAAIADCDRALTLDPAYTKARLTRARALGQSGDWENAVRELKAHAENNPSEPGLANEIRNAELELKKSKRKDYYAILGIDKDASETDIKKAYRRLAIQHHPDKNIGLEGAEAKFKDIGEAYETLSDPQKRARFDSGEDLIDPSEMFGGGMGGHPFGGMGGGMQIDPEMLFNMMGGGGGGGFGGGAPRFSFATGPGGGQRGGFPF